MLQDLGDHLRKRRLDLGLRQRDVAERIGVTTDTITNWEVGQTEPTPPYLPDLLGFLGYDPRARPATLAEQLRHARVGLGLSQRELARRLGVDPCTVQAWETERHKPTRAGRELIERFLKQEREADGYAADR